MTIRKISVPADSRGQQMQTSWVAEPRMWSADCSFTALIYNLAMLVTYFAFLLQLFLVTAQQDSDLTIGCKGDGSFSDFVCGLSAIYSFNGPAATYLASEFAGNTALQSRIDAVDISAGNIAINPTNAAGHIDPNVLLSALAPYATGVVKSVLAEASARQNGQSSGTSGSSSIGSLPSCAMSCVNIPSTCQSLDWMCICSSPNFLTGISCCSSCSSSDQTGKSRLSLSYRHLTEHLTDSKTGAIAFARNICSPFAISVPSGCTTSSSSTPTPTSTSTTPTAGSKSVTTTPTPSGQAGSGISGVTTSSAGEITKPTVTDVSVNVAGTFNNKPLIPISEVLLRDYLGNVIPDNMNVSCITCSSTGAVEIAAGGWTPGDDDMSIAEEFKDNGWVKFVLHGVTADIEPVFNLLPGFKIAHVEIPVYRVHLKTLNFTSKSAMDFYFLISLPITIQLNSEVDIYPSLKIRIPDGATVYLDIGNPIDGSSASGFDATNLTANFNIDDPNLSVTMLHGVTFKLLANASTSVRGLSSFNAAFNATLALPQYNTTISSLKNVNSNCQAPGSGQTSFAQAVHVQYAVGYDLSWNGQVFGKPVGKGDLSNGSLPLADGCFAWDANSHSVKVAVNAGMVVEPPFKNMALLGLVAFVAAAIVI